MGTTFSTSHGMSGVGKCFFGAFFLMRFYRALKEVFEKCASQEYRIYHQRIPGPAGQHNAAHRARLQLEVLQQEGVELEPDQRVGELVRRPAYRRGRGGGAGVSWMMCP